MQLRPEFTMKLSLKVLLGGFVNLVGPHGQGRRRTLSDLFEVLPASMPIIFYDLKQGEEELISLLALFAGQHGQVLFVLHNVNLLQNRKLLEALIEEAAKHHKALLTVSESEDDLEYTPDAQVVIPQLTAAEINRELVNRGMAKEEITGELITSIANRADPYSAMAELAEPGEMMAPKKNLLH